MVFHLSDALEHGSSSGLVHTVNADVVVMLIGKFRQFRDRYPVVNLCVAFGTGKHNLNIHINTIAHALARKKSTLPIYHSFTGCDTVSAFLRKGQKSAREAWKCFPDAPKTFNSIAMTPCKELDNQCDNFRILEHYTVVLYQQTSQLTTVNEARREMFCKLTKTMEAIPPTQSALLEHTKRAVYQAGIWYTSDVSHSRSVGLDIWHW